MRKLHSYSWSYISVVPIARGCPCIGIECIACTEQNDYYIFAIKALLKMAPGQSQKDIMVIFGDGILSSFIL